MRPQPTECVGCALVRSGLFQAIINAGGNINAVSSDGWTPLLAIVRVGTGDAAARLRVLLAYPHLDLDAQVYGSDAATMARTNGLTELADAIELEVGGGPINLGAMAPTVCCYCCA